ncbi:MAG: DUF4149 domain-containing protein [Pyrinomonadaceae bacterium]|nr:DUF4149 domain-containing protein [Pyrinomonadaceae bacterium]
MKFFSDIRLLILAIWLGAAVFFIGVAQSAFAVLPSRELAGNVVNRTLAILNYSGIVVSLFMIATTLIATSRISRLWLWVERCLLLVVAATCAIGQFVIGFWLSSIRLQLGRPIDEVAVDDPMRIQFNALHEYSVWVLFAGMIAALITFFVIANRKFGPVKTDGSNVYDFQKEFKI